MNILKLTASSLLLMTAFLQHATAAEADYPVGVKFDRNGQPVENTKSLVDITTGIGATSIRYAHYAASGMFNRDNSTVSYGGGGCMTFTAGAWLDVSVDIPDGSKIVGFTLFGNDNSASGSVSLEVLALDGLGAFESVVSTTGTTFPDTPGFFQQTFFVDYDIPFNRMVNARVNATAGTGNEACGVRVAYIPPSVASDVLFVDNFTN